MALTKRRLQKRQFCDPFLVLIADSNSLSKIHQSVQQVSQLNHVSLALSAPLGESSESALRVSCQMVRMASALQFVVESISSLAFASAMPRKFVPFHDGPCYATLFLPSASPSPATKNIDHNLIASTNPAPLPLEISWGESIGDDALVYRSLYSTMQQSPMSTSTSIDPSPSHSSTTISMFDYSSPRVSSSTLSSAPHAQIHYNRPIQSPSPLHSAPSFVPQSRHNQPSHQMHYETIQSQTLMQLLLQ